MSDATVISLILQSEKFSTPRNWIELWEVERTVKDKATTANLQQINVIKL